MTTTTDRIEKTTLLRAPRERVWRAVTDAKEFGILFGVEFERYRDRAVLSAAQIARIEGRALTASCQRTYRTLNGMN